MADACLGNARARARDVPGGRRFFSSDLRPATHPGRWMAASKKGTGGSQLAQLRSGLRAAGVTGPKPKKGKRHDAEDSRVGQYRAQQRRKRLESLMTNLNTFDERVSHSKNQAIGTKTKGTVGRPADAKSASLQQRRAKLLPEYDRRHKSSSFVDRRFGEYNPSISLEDKMLKRFTEERMNRAPKTSMFDLNDDDAELGLTHFGQSLSGLDEMPDVPLEDDDDDDDPGTYTYTASEDEYIFCVAVCAYREPCQQHVLLEITELDRD